MRGGGVHRRQRIIDARERPCLDDTHGVVDAVTILVTRLVEARKILHEQLQGLRGLTSKTRARGGNSS